MSVDEKFLLFVDIDAFARFKFHIEVVLKNGDLLDELPDECLVKFRDVGSLLDDEVLQLFDSVHGFFPAVAV